MHYGPIIAAGMSCDGIRATIFFLVVPFLSTNSTKTTSSAYELESPAGNRFEMLYDNGLDLEEQISICSNILISLANFR